MVFDRVELSGRWTEIELIDNAILEDKLQSFCLLQRAIFSPNVSLSKTNTRLGPC